VSQSVHPVRWWVKKATRCGVVLAASGFQALGPGSGSEPRVRVLTYHRFRKGGRDPFSVDPERFDRQMRWLAEHDLAVSLADLQAFLLRRRRLRNGSVLVTIDDGHEETWSVARPILQRHGIPAVAFVPSEVLAAEETAAQDSDTLSAAELKALPDASIDIGSHSWQHRSLGRMSPEDAGRQVVRSKRDLETALGRPVAAFAYPFGTRRDFNATTARLLESGGYRLAFTSQHGAIAAGADPYTLPRIKVEGGEPLWMFKRLVSGALDGWSLVDRSLWWLQHSKAVPN